MFVAETHQGEIPFMRHLCQAKSLALRAARSHMNNHKEDGVMFVSGSCHEVVMVLVRDKDLTGDEVQEMSLQEWEQT